MADYVTKIRTSTGDKQIDYNALANLPNLDPVASATKLAIARNILTNLESTLAVAFNGTDDIAPGVTGILQEENGGTGVSSIADFASKYNIAQIAVGSYVGTGTNGSDNPCSLTFQFVPSLFVVSGGKAFGIYIGGASRYWAIRETDASYGVPSEFGLAAGNASVTGKTLAWYGGSSRNQFNESDITYKYVAIG